jgi:hypothetical protein
LHLQVGVISPLEEKTAEDPYLKKGELIHRCKGRVIQGTDSVYMTLLGERRDLTRRYSVSV